MSSEPEVGEKGLDPGPLQKRAITGVTKSTKSAKSPDPAAMWVGQGEKMKNPRTGREMPPIWIEMGDLRIRDSTSGEQVYVVTCPTGNGSVSYTIAVIYPREDGCDLRTVGQRPWKVKGIPPQEVFSFCLGAMKVIDTMISGEIDA